MRSILLASSSALFLLTSCNNNDKDASGIDSSVVDSVNESDDSKPGDTGTPQHSDSTPHSEDTVDSTIIHSDTAPSVATPADIAAGDLIITEIMVQPSDCNDPHGEYVEFFYKGSVPVDIKGLRVQNGGATQVSIQNSLLVNPNQYVVLYNAPRNKPACYTYPPLAAPYESALSLPNGGDSIQVLDQNSRVLDTIDYRTFGGVTLGASFELTGDPATSDNTMASSWCVATSLIPGGTSDLGTPAAANTCVPDTGNIDTSPPATTLMITEVLDFDNPNTLRYVEIFNPTSGPLDLDNYAIRIYTDGATTPTSSSPLPSGTSLASGDFFVVGPLGGAPQEYQSAFSYTPDLFAGAITGDGDDAYELTLSGAVVDAYGVPGVDGSGKAWDYTDAVAWRKTSINEANTNFDINEWEISPLTYHHPGLREPATNPGGSGAHSGLIDTFDTSPRVDTYETDLIDTSVTPYTVADLQPGDLVITEIMVQPSQCAAPNGQYVAFVVDGSIDHIIDLAGLSIENGSGSRVTFSNSMLVHPGQEVIAWYKPPTGTTHCYNWAVGTGLDYTVLTFNTGGDTVRFSVGSTILDEVNFSAFTVPYGASLNLDPTAFDRTSNNTPSKWCPSENYFWSGQGQITSDKGSPGSINANCPLSTDTDANLPVVLPADLAPGDLVITEIMASPGGTCNAADGEYIEIKSNVTGVRVQLNGLEVSTQSAGGSIATGTALTGDIILEPGGVAVLYRTPSTTQCFGFPTSTTLTALAYGPGLDLPDANATVRIGVGSTILDDVNYGTFTPPTQIANAWSLDSGHVDIAANNGQNNWCAGGTTIGGGGNIGTPGIVTSCATP